jgi:hypothetical protein
MMLMAVVKGRRKKNGDTILAGVMDLDVLVVESASREMKFILLMVNK